jgi:hypothetical protein
MNLGEKKSWKGNADREEALSNSPRTSVSLVNSNFCNSSSINIYSKTKHCTIRITGRNHISQGGGTSCYWACATVSSLTMGSVRPKLCATAIMCKMPRTNSALSQLPGMPYVNKLGSTLTPSKKAIVGT